MPGKKKGKGKKKGGKGKGDKKEAPPPVVAEEEVLSELSKEFYLIQIKDLEERVGRYQEKCDKLESSTSNLQKKLTQKIEDQEHIIALLKSKIQEQSEQCAELDDQLTALKHEKDTITDRMTKEIAAIREDAQDRLDQLIAENTALQATLDSLEEFKINKEKLEADLKSKQEEIEEIKKEFDNKVYILEKQAVLDKDRMRKEMVSKVNSVAAEFRKVSDLQMADTTKRTIQENVLIGQQLYRMSDKTTELVKENERLKDKEKEMSRRIEIMETTERDMTRKSIGNQKIMLMLRDKIQEQQKFIDSHANCKTKVEQLEQELEKTKQTALMSTQQAETYKSQMKALDKEIKDLEEKCKSSNDELGKLKGLLKSAAQALKSALKSESTNNLIHNDEIISTILDILLTAPKNTSSELQQTSYKPGDLGFVPPTKLPPLKSSK